MPENIKNVIAAIDYIESHLHEKLDLKTIEENEAVASLQYYRCRRLREIPPT